MAFKDIVNIMREQIDKADSSKIKGIDATFQFELSGEEAGTFHLKVADESIELVEEVSNNPNVTVMIEAQDFRSLLQGELNATSAFMAGKLKIKGDMSLAMKLQSLLN